MMKLPNTQAVHNNEWKKNNKKTTDGELQTQIQCMWYCTRMCTQLEENNSREIFVIRLKLSEKF